MNWQCCHFTLSSFDSESNWDHTRKRPSFVSLDTLTVVFSPKRSKLTDSLNTGSMDVSKYSFFSAQSLPYWSSIASAVATSSSPPLAACYSPSSSEPSSTANSPKLKMLALAKVFSLSSSPSHFSSLSASHPWYTPMSLKYGPTLSEEEAYYSRFSLRLLGWY